MSGPNAGLWPQLLTVPIGTQAATISLPAAYFRKHGKLKAVRLVDQAGVAADNTNFLTVTLQDSGATPKVYASYDSRAANQGALTALVSKLMTLGGGTVLGSTAGATATVVASGEVDVPAASNMILLVTVGGTGAFTKALLQLEFYPL